MKTTIEPTETGFRATITNEQGACEGIGWGATRALAVSSARINARRTLGYAIDFAAIDRAYPNETR